MKCFQTKRSFYLNLKYLFSTLHISTINMESIFNFFSMKRGLDDEIDGNAEKMAKLQGKYQQIFTP